MTSPLERVLCAYVDAVGGVWVEEEPQVYDVLWPDADQPQRLTVDPEALADHPEAQILAFGLPLLDDLLARAQASGPTALAYLDDLHLSPHGLERHIERDLTWPDDLAVRIGPPRARYVLHTLFWFAASYESDDLTQALYTAGVDGHYGRLVRHLEGLLATPRLSEERRWPHPDAPAIPIEQAYALARERVLRTVVTEAHSQLRDWQERQRVQIARMQRYFADMRAELQERSQKAAAHGEETAEMAQRVAAVDREAALRIEELRRAAGVRVKLQLTNVLQLKIPRLFVDLQFDPPHKSGAPSPAPLTASWDPLVEKTDALECPHCGRPTYALLSTPRDDLGCPACAPTQRLRA